MIGILAIQGGYIEHEQILNQLGLEHKRVRSLADTQGLTGFIIPGGESTVMDLFMTQYGLKDWLLQAASAMPIYGTCAGLILLARYGLIPATVERNAYGRQSASFVADLELQGGGHLKGHVKGHFIRAPKIVKAGEGLDVLAEYEGSPVLVRKGSIWASTFHPELAGESVLHRLIFS